MKTIVLFALCALTVRATNLGFESGAFPGWTLTNPLIHSRTVDGTGEWLTFATASVDQTFLGYTATEGTSFAKIGSDGGKFSLGTYDQWQYAATLRQSLDLGSGDTLSGFAAFWNGDWSQQDSAWVRIYDSNGAVMGTPWSAVSGGINWDSGAPWTDWEWTCGFGGSYIVELGMASMGDNEYASFALFDGVGVRQNLISNQLDSGVPDATGTASLLALGLAGLMLVINVKWKAYRH